MKVVLESFAFVCLRALAAFLGKLPEKTALALGRFAGHLLFYFSQRRHVAYADLKAALGSGADAKERRCILWDHYGFIGETAVEMLRSPLLDRPTLARMIRIDRPEHLQRIFQDKRGAIFLTAHLGNWELAQLIPLLYGKRLHVLARHQRHTRLNQFLNRLREGLGSTAVGRGMGIRSLLRALRRGEFVALLGDQDAGKQGGLILPFLGRKTSVPTGAFELARASRAPIIPCFIVRREENQHEFFFGDALDCAEGEGNFSPEAAVRRYLEILEDFIRRFPSQWLWETKRWKYTWTKRLLILSDGKPGHLKQAEAVAAEFRSLATQYGRPGMEYPTQTLAVQFRSEFRKRLFPWFAFFFIPWAQGRLGWLRFFFTPETQKALEEASAEFIISAGASLVPLNLCLAYESCAKSVVVMKPNFPFHGFRYDLALVPAHDRGPMPRRTFRTLLAPSGMDPAAFEEAAEKLKRDLRDPERIRFGIFLGGPTRRFSMEVADIESFFSSLARLAPSGGDYLVTTSRRTPAAISQFLKEKVSRDPACQLLVIAAEDSRPQVASGIMALADVLMVTEDSISMISEAVSTGKQVIVLRFHKDGLPAKHRRFHEILARESAVRIAYPENLEEAVRSFHGPPVSEILQEEKAAMRARLQEIL